MNAIDNAAVDPLPMVVLIPTHGRPTLLERTIDSVLACHPPADREVRLIVVENGGRQGAEALLARKGTWLKPEYRYHERPNKSEALNSVLRELDEVLIVFFDDDVRMVPEILQHYARAAGQRRGGKFFGGGVKIDYEDEQPPPPWLLRHLPTSATGWHPPPDPKATIGSKLAFLGFNWAAFSSDLKAAGGFDARFGPGGLSGGTGQERAMQTALRERGVGSEYVHDAVVWHFVPASRSSPDFALQRSYRHAITVGHEWAFAGHEHTIGGVPSRLLKLALARALRIPRTWVRASEAERFVRRLEFAEVMGQIRGVRDRAKFGAADASQGGS